MSDIFSDPTNPAPLSGIAWRMVEAQNKISTMKLVDNTDEQMLLEALIEDTKPTVPTECRDLDYLLFSPFRYNKSNSRFRRPSSQYGVFYAAEAVETALAEIVFHRLLRLGDAPDVPWPTNPVEFTAFSIKFETAKCADLTAPPFEENAPKWEAPEDYTACQDFANNAQKSGIEVIRSTSLRDPERRPNISIISCAAFAKPAPLNTHNWHIRFSATGVQARSQNPAKAITFAPGSFAEDPRMANYTWNRPNSQGPH